MITYTTLVIDDSQLLYLQKRNTRLQYYEYVVQYEDVRLFPGFVLETLALKFYGNRRLWYKIYDANPVIPPDNYQEGMTVRIPLTSYLKEARKQ